MDSLTPTSFKKRAAESAADHIRKRILKGEFQAGSVLPPERELSASLDISRLTLRTALTRLETEGLVRPVRGSGNRVLDFRRNGGMELLGPILELARDGGEFPLTLLGDLLKVRRRIAGEIVELACERATEKDKVELRTHVLMMRGLVEQPKRFVAADLLFAHLMIRAAHSMALELLINPVLRVLEAQEGIEFAFMMNPEGTINAYDAMVDRVEAGDAASARKLAERLFERMDTLLVGGLKALAGGVSD